MARDTCTSADASRSEPENTSGSQHKSAPRSQPETEPSSQSSSSNSRRQSRRTSRSPHASSDSPEMLLQFFINAALNLWQQVKQISSYIMVEMGGYKLFDQVAHWCIRNPQISICLLAGGIVMFLPFIIIMGFGISTIVLTFTGFLVLEGTLLSMVSLLLFGCLGALVVLLLFFAVFIVAIYFGFAHIYDIYGGLEQHKQKVVNFLQSQRAAHSSAEDGRGDNLRSEDNIQNLPQEN